MDVASAKHIEEVDHDSDVTPEALTLIRQKASPTLEGKVFTLISSGNPDSPIGQGFRVRNGVLTSV